MKFGLKKLETAFYRMVLIYLHKMILFCHSARIEHTDAQTEMPQLALALHKAVAWRKWRKMAKYSDKLH